VSGPARQELPSASPRPALGIGVKKLKIQVTDSGRGGEKRPGPRNEGLWARPPAGGRPTRPGTQGRLPPGTGGGRHGASCRRRKAPAEEMLPLVDKPPARYVWWRRRWLASGIERDHPSSRAAQTKARPSRITSTGLRARVLPQDRGNARGAGQDQDHLGEMASVSLQCAKKERSNLGFAPNAILARARFRSGTSPSGSFGRRHQRLEGCRCMAADARTSSAARGQVWP